MIQPPGPIRTNCRRKAFRKAIPLYLALLIFLLACDRGEEAVGEVRIHLIESYEYAGAYPYAILESSVEVCEQAFIAYEDLLYYDRNAFEFGLSEAGIDSIEKMECPVSGIPIAIMADGELIYTAHFWPIFSSMGCQWTVMDPIEAAITGTLTVRQGYPGEIEGFDIPDHRNDPRILRIFIRDGKLRP